MLKNNAFVYKDNLNMESIEGFMVQQVSNDVFAIDEFGIALMYLIIGNDKALLIDTGMGLGNVKRVTEKITDLPIVVVNSHHHYDHAGGNLNFKQIFCHKNAVTWIDRENTTEYREKFFLRQEKRKEYSGCSTFYEDMKRTGSFILTPFEEGYIFDLGGRRLEVIFTPGHTDNSICLLDRENRLLFTLDTLCSTPTLVYDSYSTKLEVYYNSLLKLKKLRNTYELIFPGHYLKPIGSIYLDNMIKGVEEICSGKEKGIKWSTSESGIDGYYYRYERASFIYSLDRI